MKKNFLFSAFCLLLFSNTILTQEVYELRYRLPGSADTTVYNAMIILAGNGTGVARIVSTTGMTEMELTEQYAFLPNGDADTSFLFLEGMATKIIKGTHNTITAHTYLFKQTDAGRYLPWAVLPDASTTNSNNNLLQAVFYSNTELLSKKQLGLSYFDTASHYYKNIFDTKTNNTRGLGTGKGRMFLLIVASTRDSSLMPNALIDARKVVDMFTDIAQTGLRIPIYVDSVYGNRYNKEEVDKALLRLKPLKDDIVVFYYSGHGFADQKQRKKEFPFLDLRDPNLRPRPAPMKKALNIQDIYAGIIKKGAKINLVISDCCNDTVEAKKTKSAVTPPSSRAPLKYNAGNLASLFLNKPVNMLMTAATQDERAIITPRFSSYFTHFFLESLRSYVSPAKGNADWYLVFDETKKMTTFYAGKVTCPNGKKCMQTPKLYVPR